MPQYTPGAAYKILEFLLRKIEDLSVRGDYTTQRGKFYRRDGGLNMA